jgi:tartrate/fumarate subfamily iron-sulfur-dependent hydro-lyase alpha chain
LKIVALNGLLGYGYDRSALYKAFEEKVDYLGVDAGSVDPGPYYLGSGGGSECFGGTRHRIVAFADGLAGIKKCVIDNYIASTRAGAICPPSVLGIGIGGTANVAANLAKEAACLRTIGSKNPEPAFAKLEEELYDAINRLGIGIMGIGGDTSVLAVHIEYAHTHIAGIAVATSSNCMVARRAACRINDDNSVIQLDSPNWFGGR